MLKCGSEELFRNAEGKCKTTIMFHASDVLKCGAKPASFLLGSCLFSHTAKHYRFASEF
jgi:hypothetical protein